MVSIEKYNDACRNAHIWAARKGHNMSPFVNGGISCCYDCGADVAVTFNKGKETIFGTAIKNRCVGPKQERLEF